MMKFPSGKHIGFVLLYAFVSSVVIVQFFNTFFFGNFDRITGTPGDARFLLSIFEHWHNVFKGEAEWMSPPIFFPIEKTLGYSDGLFAAGFFHHVFRSLGFDPFHAYELTLILTLFIGFNGTFWLVNRVLGVSPVWSLVTAAVSVSINGMQFQAFHGQLIFFSWLPMLFGFFYMWLATTSRSRYVWLSAALLVFVVLMFTAFYAVWFGVFLLIIMISVFVLYTILTGRFDLSGSFQYLVVQRWSDLVLSAIVLAISGLVFVDLYSEAREIGLSAGFGWAGVVNRLPQWNDILYIERFNWLYNDVFTFYDVDPNNYQRLNDLSTGFTPVLLLVFVFTTVGFVYFARKASSIYSTNGLVLLVSLTIVLASIVLYRFGPVSLWRVPFHLIPGADGIRGASRLNLVLGQFMVVVVFYGAYLLHSARTFLWSKWGRPVIMGGLVFITLEQVNTEQFNYDRIYQSELLTAARPAEDCELFYVVDSDKVSRADRVVHITANVISTYYNVKTPMGHSGVFPEDYLMIRNPLNGSKAYAQSIMEWMWLYDLDDLKPVCVFDVTNQTWSEYADINRMNEESLVVLESERKYEFADASTNEILTGNWTRADKWGRWTRGKNAGVRLGFPNRQGRVLEFDLGALMGNQKPTMSVDVVVNGKVKDQWLFQFPAGRGARPAQSVKRTIALSSADYDSNNSVRIGFKVLDPRTPADIGGNPNDLRPLGLSVYSLEILDAGP